MQALLIGLALGIITIGCAVVALAGLAAYARAQDAQWQERRRAEM